MTADYSRNCIPNEKYISSKFLALLNFRQYMNFKIAPCLFPDMNFSKTLLNSRNDQYEHLEVWGTNGVCVLWRPEAAKSEISVF